MDARARETYSCATRGLCPPHNFSVAGFPTSPVARHGDAQARSPFCTSSSCSLGKGRRPTEVWHGCCAPIVVLVGEIPSELRRAAERGCAARLALMVAHACHLGGQPSSIAMPPAACSSSTRWRTEPRHHTCFCLRTRLQPAALLPPWLTWSSKPLFGRRNLLRSATAQLRVLHSRWPQPQFQSSTSRRPFRPGCIGSCPEATSARETRCAHAWRGERRASAASAVLRCCQAAFSPYASPHGYELGGELLALADVSATSSDQRTLNWVILSVIGPAARALPGAVPVRCTGAVFYGARRRACHARG